MALSLASLTKKKGSDVEKVRKKGPSELVAVDLATTGIKAIKAKAGKDGPIILAADILPPIKLSGEAREDGLPLTKNLTTYYAAMAFTADKSVVRHLTLAGAGENLAAQVREHLGIEGEYRLSFLETNVQQKKKETRVLAAAIPEDDAAAVTALVETGSPAPVSLEISGLSAISAFSRSPVMATSTGGVAFVESGARQTYLVLFHDGVPSLVRKFDFGSEMLVQKVHDQMKVDRDVAEGIVLDGSIDISQATQDVVAPFLRQLTISRDFVERRENCNINTLYLSGGMALSRHWRDQLQQSSGLKLEVWNPLEGMTAAENAMAEHVAGQEPRFAAAVGALMGVFDRS